MTSQSRSSSRASDTLCSRPSDHQQGTAMRRHVGRAPCTQQSRRCCNARHHAGVNRRHLRSAACRSRRGAIRHHLLKAGTHMVQHEQKPLKHAYTSIAQRTCVRTALVILWVSTVSTVSASTLLYTSAGPSATGSLRQQHAAAAVCNSTKLQLLAICANNSCSCDNM